MKKKWLVKGLSFLIISAVNTCYASSADDLIALFSNLKTFSADFKQNTRDSSGADIAHSKGRFIFQRPDRLFWHTLSPDEIRIVGDGKTLWHYDVVLGQIVRQPLKEVLEQTPALLLAGDSAKLQHQFKIEEVATKQCGVGQDHCFKLTPIGTQGSFVHMWVGFFNAKLTQIKLKDQLDQFSFIVFQKVKINESIDPKLFAFQVPAGVEVLEQ